MNNLKTNKIEIQTYDLLSVLSHELQISPPTVNSVTRLAWAMFPERIERIDQSFVHNLWVNRILIQLPDGLFGIVDAELWHTVYYYLKHFSGLNMQEYVYDKSSAFPDWFAAKVAEQPVVEIDISTSVNNVPSEVTKEYLDINNRLLISLYVINAFGNNPKAIMQKNLVSTNVVNPPA
jgi:hypothetical protein